MARGEPWSARAIDAACGAFAVWTLCCHAAVALGASLRALVLGFAGVGAALLLAWLARTRARRRAPAAEGAPAPEAAAPDARGPAPLPRDTGLELRGAVLLVGAGIALWLSHWVVAFWWSAVALLSLAAVLFVVREPARAGSPARGHGLEAGLLLVSLAAAALALVAHRVDIDDAFYVNVAAAAADAPAAPLLAGDTLHGVEGLPLLLPLYRLHGYELGNAALAWLTGMPAIACFHFVSAALGAALLPLALARLCRWLTPAHWLWTVAVCIFVSLAAGDVHRWYGNFGLVRIWQGKSLMLWVFLPLVQAYALAFALRPRPGAWLRLAGAQVAALGCSASALWAAPAAALAAASCALPLSRRGLGRLLLAALASSYLVGAGLVARSWIADDPALREVAHTTPEVEGMRELRGVPEERRHAPGVQLDLSLALVAGDGRLRTALLLSLVAAWTLAPAGLGRRFAIVVPLAVLVTLLDPYTSEWVSSHVTGASTWRAFWLLPVPLLLALMLVAPLGIPVARASVRRLAVLGACALFAGLVPLRSALAASNGVELVFPPRLKVDPEAWRWAQLLTERAGAGAVVVAPESVCVWLPTLHGRVYPLVVRPMYLARYEEQLGTTDVRLRLLMTALVSGGSPPPRSGALFASGLDRFGVRAVLLPVVPGAPRLRSRLRAAGFARDLQGAGYEIWLRPPGAGRRGAATSSSSASSSATAPATP